MTSPSTMKSLHISSLSTKRTTPQANCAALSKSWEHLDANKNNLVAVVDLSNMQNISPNAPQNEPKIGKDLQNAR